MPKISLQTLRLKSTIITPIHIDNGEVYDRLDYFLFDWWEELQIVDRKWLLDCVEKFKDRQLFEQIINSIKKWRFDELESLKVNFYENYFDPNEYLKKEIKTWNEAVNHLISEVLDWNKNNAGEIKRFITDKFWNIIIPWSTLKWIFRTVFLFYAWWELEKAGKLDSVKKFLKKYKFKEDELRKLLKEEKFKEYKVEKKKLKNLEKGIERNLEVDLNKILEKKFIRWDLNVNVFSLIEFEDTTLSKCEVKINKVQFYTKAKNKSTKWVPQTLELVSKWTFEIKINNMWLNLSKEEFKNMLKNYSKKVIEREKHILNNLGLYDLHKDFIVKLNDYLSNWKYPIKIWMFKKSLAYKIFWEDMINELNKRQWNNWSQTSRKWWVWDKTLYVDENKSLIWWIVCEFDE